jgi:hypothetical protein
MNAWSLNLEVAPEQVVKRLLLRSAPSCNSIPEADWSAHDTSPTGVPAQSADQKWYARRPDTSPPAGPTETKENQETHSGPLPVVEEVWGYYKDRLKRSPHLEMTKQRRVMGEAGLRACRRMAAISGISRTRCGCHRADEAGNRPAGGERLAQRRE